MAKMRAEPTLQDVRDCWNHAAPFWDEFVRTGLDHHRELVHGPALLAACADVRGRAALDLGCGQGWCTRQLALRGARAVGVDVAQAQIDTARVYQAASPLDVEYELIDAAAIASRWPADTFDLATACMSLQDMPDPGAVLRATRQVLAAGGRLVVSVPHPFTSMLTYREWCCDEMGNKLYLKVDGYFQSGARVVRWEMTRLRHHWSTIRWCRSLSEWSSLIAGAGFVVRGIDEPRPTLEQVAAHADLDGCLRLPFYMVLTAEASTDLR